MTWSSVPSTAWKRWTTPPVSSRPRCKRRCRAHTSRQQQPRSDAHYVAAVDVAGEETAAGNREAGRSRRDSTVVLIGERVWRHDPVLGFALPAVAIVNAYQWTGSAHHRAVRAPRAPLGRGVASPKSKHRRHRHGRRARALLERAVGPRPHRTIYIHGAIEERAGLRRARLGRRRTPATVGG